MRTLNLDILKHGFSGISPTRGAFYREAVIVAMKQFGFNSGIEIIVSGEFEEVFNVTWTEDITTSDVESWKDKNQVANFGAVGVAIMLMNVILEFKSFEEATIGTGIDFWMSKETFDKEKIIFHKREARLEVSGILNQTTRNTLNMRINKKSKQILASDSSNLSGWIVVVEFSTPQSKIIKK